MITLKFDGKGLEQFMPKGFERQVPFIISKAINDTLFGARDEQIGDPKSTQGGMIDQYVKGGATRFTKRGLVVDKARKGDLRGVIYFKEDRAYMRPVIYGGRVVPSKRRLLIPSRSVREGAAPGNTLTKYGGLKKGTLAKQNLKSYFVGERRSGGRTDYGLWQLYGTKKERKVRMIVDLSQRERQADITYPADRLVAAFANKNIAAKTRAAVEYALSTAR